MNEGMNCTVTITQRKGEGSFNTRVYEFNDYRIATAICNILDNVAESKDGFIPHYIEKRTYEYKRNGDK